MSDSALDRPACRPSLPRRVTDRALAAIAVVVVVGSALHLAGAVDLWEARDHVFPPRLSVAEAADRDEALLLRKRIEEQERFLERYRIGGQTLMQARANGTEAAAQRRLGDRSFRRSDFRAAATHYEAVISTYDRLMDPFMTPTEVRPARDASREARTRWTRLQTTFGLADHPSADRAEEKYGSARLLWQDRDAQSEAWLTAAALWNEAVADGEARTAPIRMRRSEVSAQLGERFQEVELRLSELDRALSRRWSRTDKEDMRRRMSLLEKRATLRAERLAWGLHPEDQSQDRAVAMTDLLAAGELAAEMDDVDAMLVFLERRLSIGGR